MIFLEAFFKDKIFFTIIPRQKIYQKEDYWEDNKRRFNLSSPREKESVKKIC